MAQLIGQPLLHAPGPAGCAAAGSAVVGLVDLQPGDRVRVRRADGSVVAFAVDEVRRYRTSELPTALVHGDIDHAGLRLITCGDPSTRNRLHSRKPGPRGPGCPPGVPGAE